MNHWRKSIIAVLATVAVIGAGLMLMLGGCSGDSDNETENLANDDAAMETVTPDAPVEQETVNPKQNAEVTEQAGTYDRPQPPAGAGGGAMFTGLVEDGVISQEQADRLMQFIKENMDRQNPGDISQLFYDAAAEGIVTPAQADQIVSYLGSTGLGRPQ